MLEPGADVTFCPEDLASGSGCRSRTRLLDGRPVGDRILVDGLIELVVLDVKGPRVAARVVQRR